MTLLANQSDAEHALDQEHAPERGCLLVEQLHGWMVTTDHKRIGILYLTSALLFW